MKQYVIDELRIEDHAKLQSFLDETYGDSGVEGVYWMPLDNHVLNSEQQSHTRCQPYYFAVHLEPNALSCELLVRTRELIKCTCMGYADQAQRDWLIDQIDTIFVELGIIS